MKVLCIRTEITEEEFTSLKMITAKDGVFNSNLILNEEYEVYGICITSQGVAQYLIETSIVCASEKIKDGGLILYIPAFLFELTDCSIKNEWVNSTYGNCFCVGVKGLIEDQYFIEKYLNKDIDAVARFREIKKKLSMR